MLVFNQQANIKNVNGAIADIFANRPAAQSTYYIFYSTDTQEIFYDNGAWVLLGTGGGGGVNIYNSDGTLTGNRTLDGANNDLTFSDLNVFKTSAVGNDIGLKLDFANQSYTLGDPGNFAGGFSFIIDDLNGVITTQSTPGVNGLYFDFANDYYRLGAFSNVNPTFFEVDNANQIIKTSNQGNDIGLKLDFANNNFVFGETQGAGAYFEINLSNGNISLQNSLGVLFLNNNGGGGATFLGDVNGMQNATLLTIDYFANQIIKTSNQGNDIGLKLDFANQLYELGDTNNNIGVKIDINNGEYFYGNYGGSNSFMYQIGTDTIIGDVFETYSGSQTYFGLNTIKTRYQGNDIGLKLDFANNSYGFGNIFNSSFIIIDSNVHTFVGAGKTYLEYNIGNDNLHLGDINGFNNSTFLFINDVNQIIKTSNQNNDIGLKLDFANSTYQFGQITGGNTSNLIIDDSIETIYTRNQGSDIGIFFDFANTLYKLGQLTGGNETFIYINDTSELLYTANNGNISNGLYCDFAAHVYQFGRATGGNTTYITIDDAATYPLQIDGTNVLSGSSGGSSSQHLKININGTDYKIKLENP